MLLVYWGAVVQYLLLLRVHESLLPPQTKISRWNPGPTCTVHILMICGSKIYIVVGFSAALTDTDHLILQVPEIEDHFNVISKLGEGMTK